MLRRLGFNEVAAFGDTYIQHVIERNRDNSGDAPTGLLLNVPGREECDVGHAIEYAGFSLDYLSSSAPDLDPSYHTGLSFLGAIGAIDVIWAPSSSGVVSQ